MALTRSWNMPGVSNLCHISLPVISYEVCVHLRCDWSLCSKATPTISHGVHVHGRSCVASFPGQLRVGLVTRLNT